MMRNDEEKTAFLKNEIETELGDQSQAQRTQQTRWSSWSFVVVVIALLGSLAVNIWLFYRPKYGAFPTDMKDARSAIRYETRTYTGALVWDQQKQGLARVREPGTVEYFGPPSKAVDDAWHALLHDQFPAMTDEEAAPFLPNLTRLPQTDRYHFDPDLFHSLHCLNGIRSMLSGPLYNQKSDHMHGASPENMRAHMDHCMDRIRQAIMCHGDLTPSPLYLYPGVSGPIGKAGPHTCRKWEPIRAWMDERGKRAPVLLE